MVEKGHWWDRPVGGRFSISDFRQFSLTSLFSMPGRGLILKVIIKPGLILRRPVAVVLHEEVETIPFIC